MVFLNCLGLIFWLLVLPFGIGLLPAALLPSKDRTPGVIFLAGYFGVFALLELVGIPIVLTTVYHGFSYLTYVYMSVCLLAAAAGVLLFLQKKKKGLWRLEAGICLKRLSMEEKIGYLLFFLVLGFQLYMAFTRASFDGDDAYYGVQSVIAQQIDMLYRFNPYTGDSMPLDARHALALIPAWEAFVGRMSGVHATIISHSVMPLVLLPLTYLLYFQIGKKLLADKKEMLPMFMILISLFQMFGNVSIYTAETFLLTRTWQGKSVAANLVLPAVIWIFLMLFDEAKQEQETDINGNDGSSAASGYFVLLACVITAAGVSSSLAVLLAVILSAGLAVLFAIKNRSFGILVKTGLSCIPGAVYMLVYLLVS
ncbi:MAG: hypothetical protein IKY23_03335 [Lachnospiraceae bacterium]|nr:hypothetical protein [Lachnospiraceae bacterium]